MRNPLIPELLAELRVAYRAGLARSAHELLTALAEHPVFEGLSSSPALQLFQKNFLLMNGLYQLQAELLKEEGMLLEISVLRIALSPVDDGGARHQGELAQADPLRDYYLDWQTLVETTESDVTRLLNAFWLRMLDPGERVSALETLGLPAAASQATIRKRYRQLVSEHHPDKGGSQQRFIDIRRAYEQLMAG